MDNIQIIGSNIRFERKRRNLTIDELSEIISIAPGFLGLIERGQRGTSIKNLCKIANFFSITLDQLITTPINPDLTIVSEEPEIVQKRNTILTYVNSMDESEMDFFISTLKGFKKYSSSRSNDTFEEFDEQE